MLNAKGFHYRYLSKQICKEIFREFEAQLVKVLDAGIRISHIDSHHHIHTGTFFLPVVVALAKKYGIRKIRNIRNYMPLSVSRVGRSCWTAYMKCLYPGVVTTDWFTSYSEFLSVQGKVSMCKDATVELMCHPGGVFPDEERLMAEQDVASRPSVTCINYNQFN